MFVKICTRTHSMLITCHIYRTLQRDLDLLAKHTYNTTHQKLSTQPIILGSWSSPLQILISNGKIQRIHT